MTNRRNAAALFGVCRSSNSISNTFRVAASTCGPPTLRTRQSSSPLRGQEAIAQIGNGQSIALYARCPSGVEIVGYFLVLVEGVFPAVAFNADELAVDALGPSAEVVDFAANLLLPGTRRMGCEGEIRDRASWLDPRLSGAAAFA